MEAIGEAIFDIPFMISFHAESLSKIMGAVLRAGTDMEKFFLPIYVLEFIKWNRRDGPITNGGIRERGDAPVHTACICSCPQKWLPQFCSHFQHDFVLWMSCRKWLQLCPPFFSAYFWQSRWCVVFMLNTFAVATQKNMT